MKLTSSQVADKLHVTTGTVLALMKKGKLTDLKTRTAGAKKHYPLFNSAEVNELSKTYRSRKHTSNGSGPTVSQPAEASNGIVTRLQRLEEKLDRLLAVWL